VVSQLGHRQVGDNLGRHRPTSHSGDTRPRSRTVTAVKVAAIAHRSRRTTRIGVRPLTGSGTNVTAPDDGCQGRAVLRGVLSPKAWGVTRQYP
jgi:hypothetical protein